MLLEDLQVILKVAEFRSITAAAAHLDMRTATASAALKRAEAALGAELDAALCTANGVSKLEREITSYAQQPYRDSLGTLRADPGQSLQV